MLHRCAPVFALLVAMVASPAASQVTQQENTARLDTALRLAKVLNPPETFEQRQKQLEAGMLPVFQQIENQSGGNPPPLAADQFKKVMDDVRPSYEQWTRTFAQAYAAHFSTDEMTDMIRFYSSPTGVKMQTIMPQITVEIMQQQMTELLPRIQETMRKEGIKK